MKLPIIFKNDIISEHGHKIIEDVENNLSKFGELSKSDYWGGRTFQLHDFSNDDVKQIMFEHKDFMLNKFSEVMNFDRPIYIDTLHVVRWTEGYELTPHADHCNPDGSDHPFPWRDYGTVTFLNDNFEGGVLHYPNQDGLEVPAQPGYTAIHTGGVDCLHGVTKITKGVRYTIASFITFDEDKQYRF